MFERAWTVVVILLLAVSAHAVDPDPAMTSRSPAMRETLELCGLVNDEVQAYSGADAWGRDANEAVSLVNQYI